MEDVPRENKLLIVIISIILFILLIPAVLFDNAIILTINGVTKNPSFSLLNAILAIETKIIHYAYIIAIGGLILAAIFLRERVSILDVWMLVLMTSLLTIVFEEPLTNLFKIIFARPRPFRTPELQFHINLVAGESGGYSFWSGHAASSFSVATPLILKFKNWVYKILFSLYAALGAFARVYVGVHFPSDIITGSLIGISLGLLSYYIIHKYFIDKSRNKTALIIIILALAAWLPFEILI